MFEYIHLNYEYLAHLNVVLQGFLRQEYFPTFRSESAVEISSGFS